jgi:arylsulfatase A-like enzyme
LQEAGYNTYYSGKLFNMHTVENYNAPYVNGFNGSDFLLDPFTYSYLNSTYQRNHDPPVSYEGHHTADVIAEKAYGFLSDALAADRPFFITLAPVSPHSNVEFPDPSDIFRDIVLSPPIPLPRHAHLFPDAKVPRTEHFNPDKVNGSSCSRQSILDANYED